MGMFDRNQIVQENSSLATFSSRVYGWMAIGLGVTAMIAYFIYQTGAYVKLMPFWWVWSLGTLGIAFAINGLIGRISVQGAIGLFLTYAALEGLLFGTILPAYAAAYGGQVIWAAFATGGLIFGVGTFYGMFTKADLTSLGRILSFALMGLIAVSLLFMVLSFFMNLSWAYLLISYLGLGIFVGLTVYDAQTIRRFSMQAAQSGDSVASYKLSLIMALKMYVNVIMIFWYLLQIFSSGRRN
jgi:FtsH-binding integral membrane protein